MEIIAIEQVLEILTAMSWEIIEASDFHVTVGVCVCVSYHNNTFFQTKCWLEPQGMKQMEAEVLWACQLPCTLFSLSEGFEIP